MPLPAAPPSKKNNTLPSSKKNKTQHARPATVVLLAVTAALALQPPVAFRRWWLDRNAVLELHPDCQTTENYALGAGFDVRWDRGSLSIWRSLPEASSLQKHSLWHTYAKDKPFILAGRVVLDGDPIRDGHYFLKQRILQETNRQTVEALVYEPYISLTLTGTIDSPGFPSVSYRFILTVDDASETGKLQFALLLGETAEADEDDGDEEMLYAAGGPHTNPLSPSSSGSYYNRIWLRYGSEKDEAFFGFGQHYSRWNLKGDLVPVLISEQGVGRGLQPLTFILNTFVHGVGSAWHTTYVAKPMYMTSHGRALSLKGPKVSLFDLTLPDVVTVEYWSCKSVRGIVYSAASPLDTITLFTSETGRMQPLPDWTQQGVIVGLEGGSDEVENVTATLLKYEVPLVGVWLQDWVGTRQDWDGTRLIWNWEVNRQYYPRWDSYREGLKKEGGREGGVKVLTYINPYLVDVAGDGASNKSFPHERNLFREAVENGYLIKNEIGGPLIAKSGSIEFGTIDPTNPETRAWLKKVIKTSLIDDAGSAGWMADFGEYVPFQARLEGGRGNVMHNVFPDYWASLQKEAIEEAGRGMEGGKAGREVVAFVRSGYLKTPGVAQLYWVGDQLVTWDGHDGIKTVLPAMLSGGLVGNSLSHSDVGGYTMIDHVLFKFFRPRELLFRWVEMGAFAGVMYRTHLGSFMHTPSAQVWDDEESVRFLGRFGRVFAHLAPYRKVLMEEAARDGWPVVRPLFCHFPGEKGVWEVGQQFMVGPDLLVAPVVDPGKRTWRVYLPGEGREGGRERGLAVAWRHVWTGQIYEKGGWVTVRAGLGEIPVFWRVGSRWEGLFEGLAVA